MKIAITGASGSGKTQVAQGVARKLRKQGLQIKVIDGYVEKLEKRTGLAYGIFATYPMNFQILFERMLAEQEAKKEGFHTITVGSIYETIVYCGLLHNKDWMTASEDSLDFLEGKSIMEALATFLFQTYDYRAMFFNKRDGEAERNWDMVLDQKIPEVIEGYRQYATLLTGTNRERVNLVSNIFIALHEEQIAEDEQSAV